MSTVGAASASGVAASLLGDPGSEGTNGLGDAAGGVGAAGCVGPAAGDNWAKVVLVEHNRE